jgi:aminoglycoside phosphotransferase (APT) family kinase protein
MGHDPTTENSVPPEPPADRTRAEIDDWIRSAVIAYGMGSVTGISEVHRLPWSTVLAVASGPTRLYFKAVWPAQRHEVAATALLASCSPDSVPRVVAVDESRGWMLLADAGEPLRTRDRSTQLSLIPGAVRRYADAQVASMPFVEQLLAAGVPDHRNLRARLDRLIDGYPSERDDSLTDADVERLRHFARHIESEERQLAAVQPPSIEHGDLHTGNIAVLNNDRTLIFDWGDVSVAYPFLSLAVLLDSLEERLEVMPGDAATARIVEEYVAPFGMGFGFEDIAPLIRAARLLGTISRALTWEHIASHVSAEDRATFPDPVASSLRDCLRLLDS